MDDKLAKYVEDVALFWEESGMPRIAGRILGLMLVCDPPYRSAAQLTDELGASKASVSTMTRMLLGSGLLKKVGVPGERATYYALRNDGFERRFEIVLQTVVGFRPLAERGVALLESEGSERTERLRMLGAMYAFWERELPPLVEQWRRERDTLLGEIE